MVASKIGFGSLGLSLLLAGCGPSVSEVRMQSYPSRGPACELEFVKLDMNDLSSPKGKWEMIGQVVLGDVGTLDPFAEPNRMIVRPRACDMGGEAVTIVTNATSSNGISTGSAVSYGVLRHREAKDAKPKSF